MRPSLPIPWRSFVYEFLGADGDLWHVLDCGHLVPARNTKEHRGCEPHKRRLCVECSGRPPQHTPPNGHHDACQCGRCKPTIGLLVWWPPVICDALVGPSMGARMRDAGARDLAFLTVPGNGGVRLSAGRKLR